MGILLLFYTLKTINNTSEKSLKHRDSLEMTFGKFKKDIDDTKHIIIDV